jgi:hypothetical protein
MPGSHPNSMNIAFITIPEGGLLAKKKPFRRSIGWIILSV